MSNASPAVVNESSYLTLHYRLAIAGGADLITTFNGTPATLLLGQGQLAPFLEERLIGLPEGAHETFALSAQEAFGDRNPELIQPVSKATLEENSVPDADYKVGELIDLGVKAGVVEKSGAWYSYGDERIGQGRENAKQFLRDNPQVALAIEDRIRASHGLDFGASPDEDDSLTEE